MRAAVQAVLWILAVVGLGVATGQTYVELRLPPGEIPVRNVRAGRNVGVVTSPQAEVEITAYLERLAIDPTNGRKPACNDLTRGSIWFTLGAPGVDDRTEVCEKKGGILAWRMK